jgi:CRISPR-associated protein Csm5
MASPGTVFEGGWHENEFLKRPEVQQSLNWREPVERSTLLEAANRYAGALLEAQKRYCEVAGLALVHRNMELLETRLAEARDQGNSCLLCLGWGGGLLARVAWLKTEDPVYRRIIEQTRLFRTAYQGLPFPKTRRVIFLGDQPATLPGWALLEVVA